MLQLIGVIAIVGLLIGVRRRRDGVPFAMAILLVGAPFLRLGVSFWLYMIPYSITVQQAAAPVQSLEFLFWGDLLPPSVAFRSQSQSKLRVYSQLSPRRNKIRPQVACESIPKFPSVDF